MDRVKLNRLKRIHRLSDDDEFFIIGKSCVPSDDVPHLNKISDASLYELTNSLEEYFGIRGEFGEKGNKGLKGSIGLKGQKGNKGSIGLLGKTGDKGS